jgi:hypothetical protein
MRSIETKVVHSQTKPAWNIIGETLGCKYKIARVPYYISEGNESEVINTHNKAEALQHAIFISYCFNNADKITENTGC